MDGKTAFGPVPDLAGSQEKEASDAEKRVKLQATSDKLHAHIQVRVKHLTLSQACVQGSVPTSL